MCTATTLAETGTRIKCMRECHCYGFVVEFFLCAIYHDLMSIIHSNYVSRRFPKGGAPALFV